jgi:hypothetical protein
VFAQGLEPGGSHARCTLQGRLRCGIAGPPDCTAHEALPEEREAFWQAVRTMCCTSSPLSDHRAHLLRGSAAMMSGVSARGTGRWRVRTTVPLAWSLMATCSAMFQSPESLFEGDGHAVTGAKAPGVGCIRGVRGQTHLLLRPCVHSERCLTCLQSGNHLDQPGQAAVCARCAAAHVAEGGLPCVRCAAADGERAAEGGDRRA